MHVSASSCINTTASHPAILFEVQPPYEALSLSRISVTNASIDLLNNSLWCTAAAGSHTSAAELQQEQPQALSCCPSRIRPLPPHSLRRMLAAGVKDLLKEVGSNKQNEVTWREETNTIVELTAWT